MSLDFRSLDNSYLIPIYRDKTLFFTHVAVACVLGVFCGESEVIRLEGL